MRCRNGSISLEVSFALPLSPSKLNPWIVRGFFVFHLYCFGEQSSARKRSVGCLMHGLSKRPRGNETTNTLHVDSITPRLAHIVNDDDVALPEITEMLNKSTLSGMYSAETPRLDNALDRIAYTYQTLTRVETIKSSRPGDANLEKPSIRASIKRCIVAAPSRIRAKLRRRNEPRKSAVCHVDIDELMGLKDMELDRATVSKLTPTQLAPVLSAYLVSYDGGMMEEYFEMKRCLLNFLKDPLLRLFW